MNTPILALIFNRPDKTKGLYQIIASQKPSKLYIAADGPRKHKENEAELCKITRDVFNQIDWPCEVKTFYRDENAGCGKAVSEAIDWFFTHEESGIILEDDCHPNADFFKFCEEMLIKYKNEERVKIISGNNFQGELEWGSSSYYFSSCCHIWGWATWRRTWLEYEFDMDAFDNSLREIMKKRASNKRLFLYWQYIFDMMKTNPVDTWDYQLFFSILKNNGLAIIPNKNLVSNIGFGKDATHTIIEDSTWSNVATQKLETIKHPRRIKCNKLADIYYYYRTELKRKPRMMHRIRRALALY